MNTPAIEGWLRQKQRRKSRRHCLGGIVLLIVSVPALVITYGFICAFYVMTTPPSCFDHTGIAGLVILVLCFTGYGAANRRELLDLEVSTGTTSGHVVPMGTWGSTVNPLAPSSMKSLVKLVTSLLFFAPALFLNGCAQLGKAWRVRRIDFGEAARVIAFLAIRPHRVAYTEIMEGVPGVDPRRTSRDLHRIDGVLFLVTTPAGLSLNDGLRSELERL